MATSSKKGACSANIQPAKANCLEHNRRSKVPCYVNPHLTKDNRIIFEDELIRNRKSIIPLKERRKLLYSEKTGQKCQDSFVPFREDVLVINRNVTDEQLMNYKKMVEDFTGWRVIGIYLHLDEGHYNSKYIEGNEDFAINYHAHVLYDCQDLTTGKAIRPKHNLGSKRQDFLALATGMERGNKASETGKKHVESQRKRRMEEDSRIDKLTDIRKNQEKEVQILDQRLQEKAREVENLEGKEATLDNAIEKKKPILAEQRTAIDENNAIIREQKATIRSQQTTIEEGSTAIKAMKSDLSALSEELQRVSADIIDANQAKRWKARFSSAWEGAVEAIDAIITRIRNSWQRSFTPAQIEAIDGALPEDDLDARQRYANDLMDMVKEDLPERTSKVWIRDAERDVDLIAQKDWESLGLTRGQGISR